MPVWRGTVMICIYCGLELPDDANFCRKCGKAQQKAGTARPATDNINVDPKLTRCPFPPRADARVMPLKGTAMVPAGTKGRVISVYDDKYFVSWDNPKTEYITKAEHELYQMYYTY
jgi:hypothetical protein